MPRRDRILTWALRAAACTAAATLALIVCFLATEALPLVAKIGPLRFLRDALWSPSSGLYQMTPMLAGSLLVTLGAVGIAAPLGVLCAVFTHFFAPRGVATLFRRALELLAGIPSVVYGFWGLVVLVPKINAVHPPGASLLAGIAILALMVLPTVALAADASFAAVPRELVANARALGLGKWGTLRLAVLPSARSGLCTACILQTGRALGETMAVLMVCGNIVQFPQSLFDPVRTLTANIALEMAYATGDHRAALFVSGLLLMIVVLLLLLAAEGVSRAQPAR